MQSLSPTPFDACYAGYHVMRKHTTPTRPQSATQPLLVSSRNAPPHQRCVTTLITAVQQTNATTADVDFLQESLAKVLTNQSAPITKARFQNKKQTTALHQGWEWAFKKCFQKTRRIKSFFPYKDRLNRFQQSKVIYKARFWNCKDFFIGKTRKTEHFKALDSLKMVTHQPLQTALQPTHALV